MKRLLQAPNLALATLWADQLTAEGIAAQVQRAHASSLAGEVPPDQCLPEVWVLDDGQWDRAQATWQAWQRRAYPAWACPVCREIIEGPFDQCWNCGALRPLEPGS